jgi:hypothetical protein
VKLRHVIEDLGEGPKGYDQLSANVDRNKLDILLTVLLREGRIRKNEKGEFELRETIKWDETPRPIDPNQFQRDTPMVCRNCNKPKTISSFPRDQRMLRRPRCYRCKFESGESAKIRRILGLRGRA